MPEKLIKAWECNRCGHVWVARTKIIPVTCPKCRSAYWDKPRKTGQADKQDDVDRYIIKLQGQSRLQDLHDVAPLLAKVEREIDDE